MQPWNLAKVAVTFTDGSELSDQQHRDFSVSPEEHAERCEHRAGTGGTGGRGGKGGMETKEKLMHNMEGELFFLFLKYWT